MPAGYGYFARAECLLSLLCFWEIQSSLPGVTGNGRLAAVLSAV